MTDSEVAVVVSAVLLVSGVSVFTSPDSHPLPGAALCVSCASFIFLTAVFSWLCVKDLYIFPHRLPRPASFVYEVVASCFIFELAFKLFWQPLERFVTVGLPEIVEKYLMRGQCVGYAYLCPGDTTLYTSCLYLVAGSILLTVLYGNGFFHNGKLSNGPRLERRRSARLRATGVVN